MRNSAGFFSLESAAGDGRVPASLKGAYAHVGLTRPNIARVNWLARSGLRFEGLNFHPAPRLHRLARRCKAQGKGALGPFLRESTGRQFLRKPRERQGLPFFRSV